MRFKYRNGGDILPNKTIYIREEDREQWEKAKELAGGSLSALLSRGIHEFVTRKEAEMEEMKQIIVKTYDREKGFANKSFVGRWLLKDIESNEETLPEEKSRYWSIALTQKGRIAIYTEDWVSQRQVSSELIDYDSLAAAKGYAPYDIISSAAIELGSEEVEEIDI